MALFGLYKGGYVVPQHEIRQATYRGWTYPAQNFKPFYAVDRQPVSKMPFHIACCELDLETIERGYVDVVSVYIDTAGAWDNAEFIGPVEQLIKTPDGILLLNAPFVGRRATRVGP